MRFEKDEQTAADPLAAAETAASNEPKITGQDMPSMGLDIKSGRGWGGRHLGPLYSLSLGWIRFWWIADIVTDVLERNRVALAEAANVLRAERDKRDLAVTILQRQGSK